MKIQERKFHRFTALLTSVFFFFTQLEISPAVQILTPVSSNTVDSSPAIKFEDLKLSSDWGNIVSQYQGSANKLIIQIQDAHCNFEAQSNTARILDLLLQRFGGDIRVINVEGSSGKLDTSILTYFPDSQLKKKLALHFLKKGRISAAEYLSITGEKPLPLEGIENLSVYFENLHWFEEATDLREKADSILMNIRKTMLSFREKELNSELLNFIVLKEKYQSAQISLNEYLFSLRKMADAKKIKVENYENLARYYRAQTKGDEIDFKKIENQRLELTEHLSALLNQQEMASLLSLNLYFRLKKISANRYFSSLIEMADNKKQNRDEYQDLVSYSEYLKDFEKIDHLSFADEITGFEKQIKLELIHSVREKNYCDRLDDLEFLEKFYHLELSREDLKAYERRSGKSMSVLFKELFSDLSQNNSNVNMDLLNLSFLDDHLHMLESFYKVALRRDEILVRNTLEKLDASGGRVAILIAGGFHTEGVRAKLQGRGVSYVVISPKIINLEAKSPYLTVMKDSRNPMEDAFRKEMMNESSEPKNLEFLQNIGLAGLETINTMSPLQDPQSLESLLADPLMNKELVLRKLETAKLFRLVSPSLLKIIVTLAKKFEAGDLLKEWKKRLEIRLSEKTRILGLMEEGEALQIETIEEVGGKYLVGLRLNGIAYGFVIDEKSAQDSDIDAVEKGFMKADQFQRLRSKLSEGKKDLNTGLRVYFRDAEVLVSQLLGKPEAPESFQTSKKMTVVDTASNKKKKRSLGFLTNQDKLKLKDLLENSYTEAELARVPNESSLINILRFNGVTKRIWEKCMSRIKFIKFEENYNNDKFGSWILALILIPMAMVIHFSPGLANEIVGMANNSFLTAAVKLLQFSVGSMAEFIVGVAGLGVFAGMFWVSIKTLVVHAMIFGVGNIVNKRLTRKEVKQFEEATKTNLNDFVEKYNRRKKNVISKTKISKFERPLKKYFYEILVKFVNDLPKFDLDKGRKNFETTRFITSILNPEIDTQSLSAEELVRKMKDRIQAEPQEMFHKLLTGGVTLGFIQQVTLVSELDHDIYYGYLDRLSSLDPDVREGYTVIRKEFEPIELFSKIRMIYSRGREFTSKQDLMTLALIFKIFNGTEKGMADRFILTNLGNISGREAESLIKDSVKILSEAGILDKEKVSKFTLEFQEKFKTLLSQPRVTEADPMSVLERDIVFLNWAEKTLNLVRKYPQLSDVLDVALDDVPDARWVSEDIFEQVAISRGSVSGLKRLLESQLRMQNADLGAVEEMLKHYDLAYCKHLMEQIAGRFGENKKISEVKARIQALDQENNTLEERLKEGNQSLDEWNQTGSASAFQKAHDAFLSVYSISNGKGGVYSEKNRRAREGFYRVQDAHKIFSSVQQALEKLERAKTEKDPEALMREASLSLIQAEVMSPLHPALRQVYEKALADGLQRLKNGEVDAAKHYRSFLRKARFDGFKTRLESFGNEILEAMMKRGFTPLESDEFIQVLTRRFEKSSVKLSQEQKDNFLFALRFLFDAYPAAILKNIKDIEIQKGDLFRLPSHAKKGVLILGADMLNSKDEIMRWMQHQMMHVMGIPFDDQAWKTLGAGAAPAKVIAEEMITLYFDFSRAKKFSKVSFDSLGDSAKRFYDRSSDFEQLLKKIKKIKKKDWDKEETKRQVFKAMYAYFVSSPFVKDSPDLTAFTASLDASSLESFLRMVSDEESSFKESWLRKVLDQRYLLEDIGEELAEDLKNFPEKAVILLGYGFDLQDFDHYTNRKYFRSERLYEKVRLMYELGLPMKPVLLKMSLKSLKARAELLGQARLSFTLENFRIGEEALGQGVQWLTKAEEALKKWSEKFFIEDLIEAEMAVSHMANLRTAGELKRLGEAWMSYIQRQRAADVYIQQIKEKLLSANGTIADNELLHDVENMLKDARRLDEENDRAEELDKLSVVFTEKIFAVAERLMQNGLQQISLSDSDSVQHILSVSLELYDLLMKWVQNEKEVFAPHANDFLSVPGPEGISYDYETIEIRREMVSNIVDAFQKLQGKDFSGARKSLETGVRLGRKADLDKAIFEVMTALDVDEKEGEILVGIKDHEIEEEIAVGSGEIHDPIKDYEEILQLISQNKIDHAVALLDEWVQETEHATDTAIVHLRQQAGNLKTEITGRAAQKDLQVLSHTLSKLSFETSILLQVILRDQRFDVDVDEMDTLPPLTPALILRSLMTLNSLSDDEFAKKFTPSGDLKDAGFLKSYREIRALADRIENPYTTLNWLLDESGKIFSASPVPQQDENTQRMFRMARILELSEEYMEKGIVGANTEFASLAMDLNQQLIAVLGEAGLDHVVLPSGQKIEKKTFENRLSMLNHLDETVVAFARKDYKAAFDAFQKCQALAQESGLKADLLARFMKTKIEIPPVVSVPAQNTNFEKDIHSEDTLIIKRGTSWPDLGRMMRGLKRGWKTAVIAMAAVLGLGGAVVIAAHSFSEGGQGIENIFRSSEVSIEPQLNQGVIASWNYTGSRSPIRFEIQTSMEASFSNLNAVDGATRQYFTADRSISLINSFNASSVPHRFMRVRPVYAMAGDNGQTINEEGAWSLVAPIDIRPASLESLVTFQAVQPIQRINHFTWNLSSSYRLKIETSSTDRFESGSVANYMPAAGSSDIALDRSMGHRFMRITVLTADAQGLEVSRSRSSISVSVPSIPAVSGLNQVRNTTEFRWTSVSGVHAYRVSTRGANGEWRVLRTVDQSSNPSIRLTDRNAHYVRIEPIWRNGTSEILGPAVTVEISRPAPVHRPNVSGHPTAPRPTHRPAASNPWDFVRAPLSKGLAQGIEREVDFGSLDNGKFEFAEENHKLDKDTRLNYGAKINEALNFLSQYRDLSEFKLPVTIVEDLDTWMDFGHEKGVLRIDTDALNSLNYSPRVLAFLLNHELNHAKGADEFEAVQKDLAFYHLLQEQGILFPDRLYDQYPYFAFLKNHHISDIAIQNKAIRVFLWKLELTRTWNNFYYKAASLLRSARSALSKGLDLLFSFGKGFAGKVRRTFRSLALSTWMKAVFAGSAVGLVAVAAPAVAQAQTPDLNDRISDGYHFTLSNEIPEGRIFGIRTCGASNCSTSSGREDYFIRHGENQVWLIRSRGHRYMRIAMFEETAGEPRLLGSWTPSASVTLTVPSAASAPANLAFNFSTRRLTWDTLIDVRGYEVTAYDSSLTDDPATVRDERWVSLGEVAQGEHPSLEITRAGLTQAKVLGVRGGRGGEIRGSATTLILGSYTLPSTDTGIVTTGGGAVVGTVIRQATAYVVSLTPQAGASGYTVYTSDSREALVALRDFLTTGNAASQRRARELGYQEYTSSSPTEINLRNSYGHDYMLVKTTRGSGDTATNTTGDIVLIGSPRLPASDAYFRLSYGGAVANFSGSRDNWSSETLQWTHAPREVTMGLFLPEILAPWGRPLRIEASYRSLPIVANKQLQIMHWGALTLGTRFHLFVPEAQLSVSTDPQITAAITPMDTATGIFRLPYSFTASPRATPNDIFDFGLTGEGRLAFIQDMPFGFDSWSKDPVPGESRIPTRRFARDTDLFYSRLLLSPSLRYTHRSNPDTRIAFGVRNDTEITNPVTNTLLGLFQLDLPTRFTLYAEGGNTWDPHVPNGTSPLVRGNIAWRPADVFQIGLTGYFRFADNETVDGINFTFFIPGFGSISPNFLYQQQKNGFPEQGGMVFFLNFEGNLAFPGYRERAPLNTGKGKGEEKDIMGGILKDGKVLFTDHYDPSDVPGQGEKKDDEEKINQALRFLGKYADLGGMNLPVMLVRDLDTWMDFYHHTDKGLSKDFGEERGTLRIDTDALSDKNYRIELTALLLNHELAHAKGADEMGSILTDLSFFRRLRLENPSFSLPQNLKEKHGYFEFLEKNFESSAEDQVMAVSEFLRDSRFVDSQALQLDMTDAQAIALAHELRAGVDVRSTVEQISDLFDVIERRQMTEMVVEQLKSLLPKDVIFDQTELVKRAQGMIERMAKSEITLDEFIRNVQEFVLWYSQEQTAKSEPDAQNLKEMTLQVALSFLMMAGFLRGSFFSLKEAENLIEGRLNGKNADQAVWTLDEIITSMRQGHANQITDQSQFSRLADLNHFFDAMANINSAKTKEGLNVLNDLSSSADATAPLKRMSAGIQRRVVKLLPDGNLEVGGKVVPGLGEARQKFANLFQVLKKMSPQQESFYLDFAGQGMIHPDRVHRIIEAVLNHPEDLNQGINIGDFLGHDMNGNWGYQDASEVTVKLTNNVIQMGVRSLLERYESLLEKRQTGLQTKMKNFQYPKALVVSSKTLGIDISREPSGKILMKANAETLRVFYGDLLKSLQQGQNNLNLAIPVVLPAGISLNEVTEDQILTLIFGNMDMSLMNRLKKETQVSFYEENHPAVLKGALGRQVTEDVLAGFRARGTVLDPIKPLTFVISANEEALYQDLQQDLKWIVDGTLDAKKLLIIAEHLASNGVLDRELLDFLRHADSDTLEEINRRRLTSPKMMMEEFDMRIRSQKQTASMA